MSIIEVTLLNVHGPNSHIEINLTHEDKHYTINQWDYPASSFSSLRSALFSMPYPLCSKYTFEIDAEPEDIIDGWYSWNSKTIDDASPLKDNCADAVQWFLAKYCDVPDLRHDALPFSLNHLALGITWPSVVPCPVTLPGRVMSHAIFHLEHKKNPMATVNYYRLLDVMQLTVNVACLFGLASYGYAENKSMLTHCMKLEGGYFFAQGAVKNLFSMANCFFSTSKNDEDSEGLAQGKGLILRH